MLKLPKAKGGANAILKEASEVRDNAVLSHLRGQSAGSNVTWGAELLLILWHSFPKQGKGF